MARRLVIAVLIAAVLAGGALALGSGAEEHDPRVVIKPAQSVASPEEGSPAGAVRAGRAAGDPLGARLVRRALLRERPGGRVVRALGRRTEFGSPQVLAVVEQRPGWLGVLSHHLPNSRVGWIPATAARLRFEPYTLHVDLSARALVVRHEGRVVRRVRVAIGRPANPTPTGRFAVTDALTVGGAGNPYGCCALALTGRQPDVPQGWTGGDRLAIHGTPDETSIGTAASSGCLRARDTDMRWLLSRVPLGAPVRIRA